MQRKGLLHRERPEHDQRSLQVSLTPRGAALAARYMPIAAYYEEVATGRMRPSEIEALKARLIDLYENLDQLAAEVTAGAVQRMLDPPAPSAEATRAQRKPAGPATSFRPHRYAACRGWELCICPATAALLDCWKDKHQGDTPMTIPAPRPRQRRPAGDPSVARSSEKRHARPPRRPFAHVPSRSKSSVICRRRASRNCGTPVCFASSSRRCMAATNTISTFSSNW